MRSLLALAATVAIPFSLFAAPAFVPAPSGKMDAFELVQKKGKWKGKGKMKGGKRKKGGATCACESKCRTKPPGCMTKCLRNCKVN